jgi:hypothetical protein
VDVMVDVILQFDEYSYGHLMLEELRVFLRIDHIVFYCGNFHGYAETTLKHDVISAYP